MQKRLMGINAIVALSVCAVLSACSTVKEVTNVDLWPFGKGEQSREYLPANSVPYTCEGNKKFYVRYLDKGASVWLILPDREVALAQIGSSKVYSNGISKVDLSSDDVTLEVNETTKYARCTSKPIAKVSKVEPKAVVESAKVAEPAPVVAKEEPPVAKISEPKVVEPVAAAPKVELVPEVSEPALEPEVQAVPAVDAQAAVAKTVEAWANAWRTKNANAYLNFYSAKFKPEGMGKAAWEAQRKQRVGANPAEIALTLDKLSIAADAKKATATFVQHYASGKFSDTVAKTLSLENVNGQWLIVKESAKAAK